MRAGAGGCLPRASGRCSAGRQGAEPQTPVGGRDAGCHVSAECAPTRDGGAFRGGGGGGGGPGLDRCPLENPSRWGAAAKLRRGAGPSPLARRTGPAPPFSAGLAASASAPTLWRVATQLGSFDGYCRTGLPTASRRRSRPASTRRRRLEVTQASSSSYQRNMLGHKWLNRCLNPLRSSPGLEFENWAALAGWLSSWSAEPESLGTGPGSENASW